MLFNGSFAKELILFDIVIVMDKINDAKLTPEKN